MIETRDIAEQIAAAIVASSGGNQTQLTDAIDAALRALVNRLLGADNTTMG